MISSLIQTVVHDPWPLLDSAIYALALFALTWGGNRVCRWVLEYSGIALPPPIVAPPAHPAVPSPAAAAVSQPAASGPASAQAASPVQTSVPQTPPLPATSPRAGRMIGSLERLIILLGLVAGSWEIIAAVIALKTVGRFKELDDRLQAEYFLIGSLASILWAALISLILMRFDNTWGFQIAELIRTAKMN